MKSITKLLFSFGLIFLACFSLNAQEVLSGLSHNPVIMNQEKTRYRSTEAIHLPFFDDFSNYTGYPKSLLWHDGQAFVNNTMPVFPPSIGVATLDALNEDGRIYPHLETQPFGADTLTSNPIRMDYNFLYNRTLYPSDSLYFSFYYQPGGASKSYPAVEWERIGDHPDSGDSLVLEFGYATGDSVFAGYEYRDYELTQNYNAGDSLLNPFLLPDTFYYVFPEAAPSGASVDLPADTIWKPEYVWNHIWATDGCTVDSWLENDENHLRYFKKVLIPITNPIYFRNNFQFRFRNYVSLEPNGYDAWASNVDQWHIDYVKLDQGGSCNDLYPHDVCFVSPTTSALKNYQSMPWNQYRTSDMADAFKNELANISSNVISISYDYSVKNAAGQIIGQQQATSENAAPYYNNGLYTNPYHAEPAITFSFPTNTEDSAVFYIYHTFKVLGAVGDDCIANDSCRFEQKFYNYYAYDDGTAEAGYSILSTMTNPESYMAMKFTLAQADTLRGVRMWFNSVLNDANVNPFTLMVWDEISGNPGNVLLEMPGQTPKYADNPLDFANYYFDEPFVVSGTFYVGIYQNNSVPINLGFDQNNDARAFWLYNTSGEWREPFLKGAPMIRPVLGKRFDMSTIPTPTEELTYQLYPNPADQQINLVLNDWNGQQTYVAIYDLAGKQVAEFIFNDQHNILNISNLNSGMYLLKVVSGKNTAVNKIIKR